MNDEWQEVRPKPLTYKGKTVDTNLPEATDNQIARAMQWTDGQMHKAITDMAREIAREEDEEILEPVRAALAEILGQLDGIINNRQPAPESPLAEVLRRLDALELWAYRQGARL